jgi:hypothetical protein
VTRVDLLTTTEVFDRLHRLSDGRKAKVAIDRDELRQVLVDYSVMLACLHRASGFRVVEPKPRRERPRLSP